MRTRRLLLIVAVVATIGCDRVTKHLAAVTLAGSPSQSFLADTVRLQFAENPGGFLSLGAGLPASVRTTVFTIGNGALLVALIWAAMRLGWREPARFGLALFIAGAASNWIDHAARGSVVDFLNLGVGPVRTGIFNIADVAILAGAAIVVTDGLLRTRNIDHTPGSSPS